MNNIKQLIEDIRTSDKIDIENSFSYAQICSKLLRNPDEEHKARCVIINILDNWAKLDNSTHELWTDLIESAGFYPYLQKEKDKLIFKNTAGEIRKEYHKSDNLENKYFHEEQKNVNDILINEKNLIISAPTSFGKSLLIEEIVATKKYKNIVVIQPTLALLDETRQKLKKYKSDYKIIVRTSQSPSEEFGNLFLFTAERVMEYLDFFPKIDFFVIDEFYKLSAERDDERSDVLNNAFNYLINKHKSKFYLLGPNIDGISEGFAEKYNAEFYKTNYSLVDNQVIDIYSKYGTQFSTRGEKRLFKEEKLFELLLELINEQTIIYCSSPSRVRYLATKFYEYLNNKNINLYTEDLNIIEWIKENVSKNWGIIDCLNNKIGIHDGALQKHITSTIINYFNQKKLLYLFCTSTIIEGVNTSAKNVVFFDNTKGNQTKIDFFDYSNIKGRSGRMMEHYIGRIFDFNKPPEKENILIDIPFFEQNTNVSNEILIQLDKKDIKNKESEQYKMLEKIPDEEKDIFKRNGVSVKGQINILNYLKETIYTNDTLLYWTAYPTYDQLNFVLSLAWENLLKPKETTRPMTINKLVNNTFYYGMPQNQNIGFLVKDTFIFYKLKRKSTLEIEPRINENLKTFTRLKKKEYKKTKEYKEYIYYKKYKDMNDNELFDEAVRDSFQILRHWFHYKVPKWLYVINELQKYVCEKNNLKFGDYSYYASQIENDFVRSNLSILVEYGIPKSAITKLEKHISKDSNEDFIFDIIRDKKLIETAKLIPYEKEKIIENL